MSSAKANIVSMVGVVLLFQTSVATSKPENPSFKDTSKVVPSKSDSCLTQKMTDDVDSLTTAFPEDTLRLTGTLDCRMPKTTTTTFVKRKIENNAFQIGEKLYYSVGWGPINAGSATMAIPEITEIDGEKCFRALSLIETNKFFSVFFKVRDRVESYIDVEGIFSWRFEKHLREGKFKADVFANYDQKNHLAFTDKDTVEIPEYIQDVLSMFYYIRTQDLQVGNSLYVDNLANGKVYPLEVKVLRKERIRVKAGTFDCVVVEPKLKNSGLFRQKGRLTVWFTDDERKIPVLMKSKIAIGSIAIELEKMEGVKEN